MQRLLLITTFMVSCNASAENRLGKPFNPLLGETFELVREDIDVRLIAEQVSESRIDNRETDDLFRNFGGV